MATSLSVVSVELAVLKCDKRLQVKTDSMFYYSKISCISCLSQPCSHHFVLGFYFIFFSILCIVIKDPMKFSSLHQYEKG